MANVPPPPAPADEEITGEPPGFERMPPQDLGAEQSVLGGLLLQSYTDVIADVVGVLGAPRAGVFYKPAHEAIYRAVYEMWTDGQPVDPITVSDELSKRGELARVGGASYVHSLVNTVPTAANAEYYAEIVLDRAKRRKLIEIHTRGIQRGYATDGDIDDLVDVDLSELQELALTTVEAPKLSVAERWADFVDQLEQGEDPDSIDTPWKDLNDVIDVKPGQLITIGAATSGGKSLMAVNWGTHVALRRDKPVLMFSLEMDGAELLARMTAAEARVPLSRLIRRTLNNEDWDRIAKVSDRMTNAHNFVIDDNGSATLGHIRARARWMTTTGRPPGLIIVDYLQLMEAEGKAAGQNRAQEVAALSRGLKRLAMDFRVPVVALAQFNREAKDRRPLITDFKESSAIEQDSNIILILHTELDAEGNEARPGEVDVIVAKNRNGARGRVFSLAKMGHYAKLADMAAGFAPAAA